MPLSPLRRIPFLSLLAILPCSAQSYVDLNFSSHVEATDAQWPNGSSLGPNYYSGTSMHFRDVATVNGTSVDAVISLVSTSGSYSLTGWIPEYNTTGTNTGNLGVYSVFTGNYPDETSSALGGLTYQMTFYVGGALAEDQLFTTEIALPSFRFLVYDHDGEPTQSEAIRAFYSDGLTGYQIRNGSGITPVTDGSSVTFDSRGSNHSETNDEGGFIAYYENTSSVTFELLASTTHGATGPLGIPGNTYGIFTAYDGRLSLIGGDTTNYGAIVPVPEPSAVLLCAVGAIAALSRRKR